MWVVKGCIVDHLQFLDIYTGMSRFTPGACSWKISCKFNTVFPFKAVCSQAFRGLTASSCIVYDSHSVSRSIFPSYIHVTKIICFREPTKPACTCTKWFDIIITLWQILINRTSLGLNQKHAHRYMALMLILYPCTQHVFHRFHRSGGFVSGATLMLRCFELRHF